MARSWISLLLLSLVLVAIDADMAGDLDACPDNNICLIYMSKAECSTESGPRPANHEYGKVDSDGGFLWIKDGTCDRGYKDLFARLEIEPITADHWKFNVSTYQNYDDKPEENLEPQDIEMIGFGFVGKANISFPSDEEVAFDRYSSGVLISTTTHEMFFVKTSKTEKKQRIVKYSFEIENIGALKEYFGVEEVIFSRGGSYPKLIKMKDRRLPRFIGTASKDLKEAEVKVSGLRDLSTILAIVGGVLLVVVVVFAGVLFWRCKKRGPPGGTYFDSTSMAQTPTKSRKQSEYAFSPAVGTPRDSQSRR